MDEMDLQLAIGYGFLAIVAIIFILVKMREKNDKRAEASKSAEVDQLTREVLNFQSHLDHGRELEAVQEDALQKIKAICDPIGVQAEMNGKRNSIQLTTSIDNIESLRFLNEHLPKIKELCQIYRENDSRDYLMPIFIKFKHIYDELMDNCSTERWNAFGEDKKAIVEAISDKYDKDEENLIAQ